jgi:glycosyltransferase involved in cell wall biosynthesis
MEPRVSFVVPNYNYGRYVAQAIDSLLGQTFRALEILIIDDASTDNSHGVLQRYGADPRVRLIHHGQNHGHLQTYNEGLALAAGEFVGILSADDYALRRDGVERQVTILDANPRVGFVYSAHVYVDEHGNQFRIMRPWTADRVREGLAEFADLVFGNYIANSGTLVRRSCHDELGAYDLALPHTADWELWLRLAAHHQVAYIAEPLYAYRIHGTNMSVFRHSPALANQQVLLMLEKAYAALPPDAAPALHEMRSTVVNRALLATSWGDRSLGRIGRAWRGLLDAALRSPSLLRTRLFYRFLIRTALLTLLGPQRYERIARLRDEVG